MLYHSKRLYFHCPNTLQFFLLKVYIIRDMWRILFTFSPAENLGSSFRGTFSFFSLNIMLFHSIPSTCEVTGYRESGEWDGEWNVELQQNTLESCPVLLFLAEILQLPHSPFASPLLSLLPSARGGGGWRPCIHIPHVSLSGHLWYRARMLYHDGFTLITENISLL